MQPYFQRKCFSNLIIQHYNHVSSKNVNLQNCRITLIKCILFCYKENSFNNLLNQSLSEMSQFGLHSTLAVSCVHWTI